MRRKRKSTGKLRAGYVLLVLITIFGGAVLGKIIFSHTDESKAIGNETLPNESEMGQNEIDVNDELKKQRILDLIREKVKEASQHQEDVDIPGSPEQSEEQNEQNEQDGQNEVQPDPEEEEVVIPDPPVNPPITNENQQGQDKKVSLTFDDGPDGKFTPEVLNILAEYDVKGTFFVVGTQVTKFPDILDKIISEGHELGNHTWNHADLTSLSYEGVRKEIQQLNEKVLELTDVQMTIVRAPYGKTNASVKQWAGEFGMNLVHWTIDPRDWAGTNSSEMFEHIQSRLDEESIILLHSFGGKNSDLSNTIELLPKLIEYLIEEGYEFVHASEIG